MFRLVGYLGRFRKEVIIGPIFKLLEAIFELIVPLVMASIIDIGIKNRDSHYIWKMGGLMLILGVAGLCFAIVCQYCGSRASQGIGTMLRNDLFAHINSLSHVELDKIGANSLITRITNDVNQLQLAIAMLIRLVIRAPFLVIGATVMAMMIDLKLSLIFWIIAPIIALVLYVLMHKSVPFYKKRQEKLDEVALITGENLSGARVIRAFHKQKYENERFQKAGEEVMQIAVEVGKISALLNPATFIILNGAIIAIIWFGAKEVNFGHMTQGQIIALVNYMTQISLALIVIAQLVIIFTKASASLARVNEVFDLKTSIVNGSFEGDLEKEVLGVSLQKRKKGESTTPIISFKDVSFAYSNSGENALEDISIDIMPGETIGIIGGTGSGKSTLVNLIPRFYDVTHGELLMNGLPIKSYTLESLRRKLGIVPQKSVLFYGSVLENMRWAKEDATKEEIEKAIEVAQGKEFVEKMPEQYESMIMQGGKNLSGGQKQRLTIARALVGKPEILILDDSSSALDYATDAKLRKAIREYSKDMTVIIVSQRANSIQHADKILVLEDGKIAGKGTHRQLLDFCQVYQEICMSQFSKEELEKSKQEQKIYI